MVCVCVYVCVCVHKRDMAERSCDLWFESKYETLILRWKQKLIVLGDDCAQGGGEVKECSIQSYNKRHSIRSEVTVIHLWPDLTSIKHPLCSSTRINTHWCYVTYSNLAGSNKREIRYKSPHWITLNNTNKHNISQTLLLLLWKKKKNKIK